MKTSAPWRRLRKAAFLPPLVVAAALLAPASALAVVPPTITAISGSPSTTGDTPETYTVTASDPEDLLHVPNDGYNLTYKWTVDGSSVQGSGDGTTTSSITITPKHGHSKIDVTVAAAPTGIGDVSESASAPELDVLANHQPGVPTINVPQPVRPDIPVTLTASATDPDGDPITSWTWNFGDGIPHNTSVPSITTTFTPGTYTVWVNPHDSLGAENSGPSQAFNVVNQAPVSRVTASPNPVGVGKPVTLSGTGSFDPEGGPLSYAWDFGSGVFGVWGTDPTTTTTFSTPGTQDVRLNVRDRYMATDANPAAVSVTVTARQPPAPNFVVVPAAPQTGQSVTFASTTIAGESPVTALDWDLDGDGNFNNGTGGSVVASFSTSGAHIVSLRATDTDGTSAIAQKVVNVTAAPGAPISTASGPGTVTTIASSGSDPGKPLGNPTTGPGTPKAKSARLMSPFPKVRIRGVFFKTSVKLSFISVTARAGSTVKLKCAGHGCPKQKTETKKVPKGKRSVRFTKFPNALRKGATLRVYITRKGVIGKYTRFRIRVNKAPARLDACLPASGSTRPRKCPLPK
jgi:PKD repeat protein